MRKKPSPGKFGFNFMDNRYLIEGIGKLFEYGEFNSGIQEYDVLCDDNGLCYSDDDDLVSTYLALLLMTEFYDGNQKEIEDEIAVTAMALGLYFLKTAWS